ncbi:MAG: hypothetical protein II114_08395 [Treponema sp.]|nr:hypothetical protein [Treponema sp.]MBQ4237334.1 hypothetical protein [Treponema sp.]
MQNFKIKKLIPKFMLAMAFVFCFAALFSACNLSFSAGSPYCITDHCVVVGEEGRYHKLAGAYISVMNNSEKMILSGDISFTLFDSEGKQCGLISVVSSSVDLKIRPGEEIKIIVSLDKFVGANLLASYQLGFVHFTKLNYEDGSVWIDPLGANAGW